MKTSLALMLQYKIHKWCPPPTYYNVEFMSYFFPFSSLVVLVAK
uniref:Uncharacterized protein n=1 Tax=Anguilla anguilla TaxID=7936 RepID=A0A0E9RUJ7_ANGAN